MIVQLYELVAYPHILPLIRWPSWVEEKSLNRLPAAAICSDVSNKVSGVSFQLATWLRSRCFDCGLMHEAHCRTPIITFTTFEIERKHGVAVRDSRSTASTQITTNSHKVSESVACFAFIIQSKGKEHVGLTTDRNTEQVVGLLVRHQDQVYRYIFAMLPDASDAWDVLQEASMAIVRKADDYDANRPFLPWAYRFAFLTVMDWRKRHHRSPIAFGDDLMKQLSDERLDQEEQLIDQLDALDHCLGKLPLQDRDLIRQRYESDETLDEIATLNQISLRTLYRRLDSIRDWLHQCIHQRLELETL